MSKHICINFLPAILSTMRTHLQAELGLEHVLEKLFHLPALLSSSIKAANVNSDSLKKKVPEALGGLKGKIPDALNPSQK